MRGIDHSLLVLNGLLLLGVTVTPFPTALVADEVGRPGAKLAAAVYSGIFVGIALVFNLLWRYVSSPRRQPMLLRLPPDSPEVQAIHDQYRAGPIFYAVAFGLSLWNAMASVAVCAGLALFFALPPRAKPQTR